MTSVARVAGVYRASTAALPQQPSSPWTASSLFPLLQSPRLWQSLQSASQMPLLSVTASLEVILRFGSLGWDWALQTSLCFLPHPHGCSPGSGLTLSPVPSAAKLSQLCSLPRLVWKLSLGQALASPFT